MEVDINILKPWEASKRGKKKLEKEKDLQDSSLTKRLKSY